MKHNLESHHPFTKGYPFLFAWFFFFFLFSKVKPIPFSALPFGYIPACGIAHTVLSN